ncbi:hypothetical protein APHAL10511_005516 [Amanita phalloides]|nr:hypothetical protein APHAL10511_005516 [Amanita phalloides]
MRSGRIGSDSSIKDKRALPEEHAISEPSTQITIAGGDHRRGNISRRQRIHGWALEQRSARKECAREVQTVAEKENWHSGRGNMDGVKVRDDEVHLKKAARKVKVKNNASVEPRRKKRADNIATRSEILREKSEESAAGFEGNFGKPFDKAKGMV